MAFAPQQHLSAIAMRIGALALAGLLGAACAPLKPEAQVLKTGEQVYSETCAACHAGGVSGAPRYQNESDWQKLLDEGQVILSAHGWVGVRAMPPQGGNPALSLEEFSRAVAYMGRAVGAGWQAPDAAMLEAIEREVVLRREEMAEKTR